MRSRSRFVWLAVAVLTLAVTAAAARASVATFSNTTLFGTWDNAGTGYFASPAYPGSGTPTNSSGDSEPAVALAPNGDVVVDGLAWLPYQVNLWRGAWGSTPNYFGGLDTSIPVNGNGRIGLGSGDADVEVTSAGTVVVADLDFIVNKNFGGFQLGVSVTRCPAAAASPADCTTQLLDQAGADRQWLTHRGTQLWLSYHDSQASSLVKVLYSPDDGLTWTKVGSPIAGQGNVTGKSTYNNIQGPIVADPNSKYVYDIYASGEAQTKGFSGDYNNVYVARSSDNGRTWDATLVYHAPPLTPLNNIFPSLAVDQTTGTLYAVWSDGHRVWLSSAPRGGVSWSAPKAVSSVHTSIMPWVAARGGKIDVVYYGSASEQADPQGIWNVYDAQSTNAGSTFDENQVNPLNMPIRVGAVCTEGTGCTGGNRELLDLFEVTQNTAGKAAIIYTSTEISTYTRPDGSTRKLPEIVLAYEQ